MDKNITVDEYRERIASGELIDPLIYLESIMGGQDLRGHSQIYKLALEIDDLTGGEPSPEDWRELLEAIETRCKFEFVPQERSVKAAQTLAEYIHPKRKQIDFNDNTEKGGEKSMELTESEIQLFKETFNENF